MEAQKSTDLIRSLESAVRLESNKKAKAAMLPSLSKSIRKNVETTAGRLPLLP
jgi:hypothetical protein